MQAVSTGLPRTQSRAPTTRLVLIDLADMQERLSNRLLFAGDDYLILVDTGRRDVDTGPRVLHDLLDHFVESSSNERVEGLLQAQTLHGSLVLEHNGKSVRQLKN